MYLAKIYKNNGDSTFTDINAGLLGISHSSIEWADFDGDNDLDLLITGAYTINDSSSDGFVASIYLNEGEDVFSLSNNTSLTSSHYGDVATGDFDQDGKTDIIITGFDENDQPSTIVYRNTSLLSLGNSILNNIEIYPNPSLDKQITIENKDNISLDVEIYSIKGNKVYNTIITKTKEINLNTLSNGVYLLKLTSSNSMTTKKVILK